MMIENSVATYVKNPSVVGNSSDAESVDSRSAVAANATTATAIQSTSVSLSGKAIMLSRLFNTSDQNSPPPVMSTANGLTSDSLSTNPAYFLTEGDRKLVSDMYAYAQQQGADPQYVDTLALTLAEYRQFNNGQLLGGFNGSEFDSQGHRLTSSYSTTDTATAARILNGDAINSTQLDHGFLHYILNPGNALANASNMSFMEQMVVKFSDKGTTNMSLDPKFTNYSGNDSAVNNVVIAAAKEVSDPNPSATFVADYISINGVGHWRTPALAVAANGASESATALNGTIVNAYVNNDKAISKNNPLMNLLDMLTKRNKPKTL